MEKILVVDDEMYNRILLEEILAGISDEYEIISAESGEAAFEAIMNERPSMVFLDLILPDIDGMKVVEKTRSKEEVRDTKFIITTGCAPCELLPSVQSCTEAILFKPFQQSKVAQILNNLSRGNSN